MGRPAAVIGNEPQRWSLPGTGFVFFLIDLRKILITQRLLDFDPLYSPQILANNPLRYQNLDSKELNSSVGLGCYDYCEAILSVRICGAQGQMSRDFADSLWISVRPEAR